MVIPRVPISAGLSTRGKWFSSSMVEVSRISSSLFATKTICLFWADWSQCRTVTESVQWCIDVKMKWCSLSICALTRDVEVTVAALVLVPQYLLWCNVSKTAETCDKTAPSIIERRNFFWDPEASRSKNFLCSNTMFLTSEKVLLFNYWGVSLIACFACFRHITSEQIPRKKHQCGNCLFHIASEWMIWMNDLKMWHSFWG